MPAFHPEAGGQSLKGLLLEMLPQNLALGRPWHPVARTFPIIHRPLLQTVSSILPG